MKPFRSIHLISGLIIINLYTLGLPSLAQENNDTIYRFNGKYLTSYWDDTRQIVTEPARWKGQQWATFAGIATAWTVTYAFDEDIYEFFQSNRSGASNKTSKWVEPLGSGYYSIPILAGIYIFSNRNSRHRNVALTGLKAYILAGGAAAVGKHLFHRHRPSENDPPDPYRWEGPYPFTFDHVSFPSGHTTSAFAVASVLAMGYRDKPWVGITSYTIASLVGLSRINDTRHWASDVVAGAALGSFIGITLSKINFNKKLTVEPGYSSYGAGLRMSWRLN
ncbi:MAG: phosphatase PAP2 family protein [Bacteroidetes bacterium]|nr:phosphatase PAP2 family protein [Bacteroidota bacterium]